MNVADSEKMLSMLTAENYALTENAEEADLVLLNTCHIREKARHKVISRLGVLNEIKRRNQNMKIAVAGCVAQAEGKKLLKEAPQIDILFGPGKIEDLPKLLRENAAGGKSVLSVGFKREESSTEDLQSVQSIETPDIPTITGKNEVSRYVNIISGCNNFCTFCVVPFTRGREISRTPQEIVKDCKQLIKQGASEIMLLGQNVNSYGLDLLETNSLKSSERGPFVDLLEFVAELDGLERLRFTTSNPHDFTKPLADLFAKQPKMGRYMHLPVQSGSDRILDAMKRKVTVAEYMERIEWLRSAIPDIAISTDLIVGFPGETEEDFEQTMDLVQKVGYSFIFAFKYSARKNTAAIRFRDQIAESIMDVRLAKLNQLQDQITQRQIDLEIGLEREVLFLYESKKKPGHYYGRTEHYRLVRVESQVDLVGKTLPVKIHEGNKISLLGRLTH